MILSRVYSNELLNIFDGYNLKILNVVIMSELIYGVHPVKSILDTYPKQVLKIYLLYGADQDVRLMELICDIRKHNIRMEVHHRKWLDWKVKGSVHQGVVAEIVSAPLNLKKEQDLLPFLRNLNVMPLILILDGVTDPHNLGACFRSADAACVNLVIVPRNRSAKVNPTVRKVSSGSAERVPYMRVINLSRTLKLLQKNNIRVIGTVIQSSRVIFETKLIGPIALVMGSEGFGIRNLTKKNCDELVSIPMSRSNMSLNISVATGICLFEILRQRSYQK